jgi:all-trans-retinol 13,14-reductase
LPITGDALKIIGDGPDGFSRRNARRGRALAMMDRMISYRNANLEERWDAIAIGSGMGGLAAAALLSKHARKRVLVLERHCVAGGYTHTFQRAGYEWDVGLHYIGQVLDPDASVRKAFDYLTDAKLTWSPMPDVYDRVMVGGQAYDFVTGVDRFRERMKGYFPKETGAIDKYIAAVQSAAKAGNLYFAEKVMPRFPAFLAGGLLRAPFMRWAKQTTAEILGGLTANQELKGVLTGQWGDYGLPPKQSSFGIHAIIANHYFNGAAYPVGGASRMAETMAPVIAQNGGQIVVNAQVNNIVLAGNRAIGVRMEDGRELLAEVIISDAGVRNTFGRLLPRDLPALAKTLRALESVGPSSAHLCLYAGLKQAAPEGTNLWVLPSYDHDASMERYVADPSRPFPSLFISFPSAKDPDFPRRHPDRATAEVIVPLPYRWFAPWQDTRWKKRPVEYETFKQQFGERLQRELERCAPKLAGKIDFAELSTPVTTRHFMNYAAGEVYGLSSAPERFKLRCLTPRTPLRNLYLTGQDIATLGITGAMFGGALAASAILGRNLMKVLAGK